LRIVRVALSAALAVALAACQSASEMLEGKKVDYKSAGQVPTLEIPPDLTTPAQDNRTWQCLDRTQTCRHPQPAH